MFSTSPLDWGLVALYFGVLAAVWLRALGRRAGVEDYLLAGRRITLPAFVATLVSTWYGGVLGIGEYTWRHGVSNWLVFGVPYYVGALLFALLFARRARGAAVVTIPDLLERHYGRGPALVGSLAVFITTTPAAYVLVLGTLFAAMTGWPAVPCILAAAALSIFYVDRGGLRAVVFTDQIQFALMYAGFGVLVAALVASHGAAPLRDGALPATHWTWHGGNGAAAVIVWYFIALSALVDPAFWQRASAARDPETARRGVLWSIAFWVLFDLMTTTCGLYARALLPGLADPVFAFPELARATLPPVALGLFFVGLIATVMSTIDSYGFLAATTLARDVWWRLRGGPEERIPDHTRVALWLSGGVAAWLALARRSVVDLWHDLGSITTPVLLLPVGTALLGRFRLGPRATLAAMLLPFAVTLGWLAARARTPGGAWPFSIEPIYAGLAASLAVYVAGHVRARLEEVPR
uniref:Sodium:solute symporter family protein n=1 Tax=Eiseniibacteriota bacterium TaxID=2212470 RepID=A0A832MJ27_UNCEI